MLKIRTAVEYFKIIFERTDIDETQARNDADAFMQKKYGDLFMGGYAFEDAYFNQRGRYVVEYSR